MKSGAISSSASSTRHWPIASSVHRVTTSRMPSLAIPGMIAAPHVMSVAENIEIVRRWVTRAMGGEASLADQLIAPEYISHDAGPDDPPGPQVQRATIRNMHKAFSPMRFVIDDIFGDGDRVVVRDHMIGVNTG